MEIYKNNGETYNVEDITYGGIYINVNGTTITDCKLNDEMLLGMKNGAEAFTVFCNGEEIMFGTFEEAYDYAMHKQKDTFRI